MALIQRFSGITSTRTVLTGLCILVIALVALLIKYILASRRPKNFPPGPPTVPLLGNIPQLPSTRAFVKYALSLRNLVGASNLSDSFHRFHEWTKGYGSIIGLKLGPQNVVILNNYKHIKE